MLPAPVSFSRRPYRKPSVSGGPHDERWRRQLRVLFSRSRVTNLAVVILAACLALSLLLNVRRWLRDDLDRPPFSAFDSIESTIARPGELRALSHLIIVPGHGVWLGNRAEDVYNESMWALEVHQSGEGAQTRIQAFVEHIRKGVELADDDPESLLVFTGGATRYSTPLTESASYLSLALALSLLAPSTPNPHTYLSTYARTTTEAHALDSFQNLLFALARFRGTTGHYPVRVTVIGYALKAARFTALHRAALRWPVAPTQWTYVGIDMADAGTRGDAMRGELENGYTPYSQDLYGCHGGLLAKRRARNVHHHAHPYHAAAPEIAALLEWCPSADVKGAGRGIQLRADTESNDVRGLLDSEETYTQLFDGPLPWDGL